MAQAPPLLGQEVPQALQPPPEVGGLMPPPLGGEVPTALHPPDFTAGNAKDASGDATVDPNTLGTLVSHVATQVNPFAIVSAAGKALVPESAARLLNQADQAIFGSKPLSDAEASTYGPLNALRGQGAATGATFDKAKAAYAKGDYGTAARHFVDYLIPLAGPGIDKSADLFQAGKWAAGGGDAIGIGLALFAPAKIPEAVAAVKASPVGDAIATAADAGASRRIVDVMAPKVGANKIRFGNAAADVAPAVARQTTGLGRAGLSDSIAANLENATATLDEAANARLAARTVPTQPVIDALKAKRARLTAQPVDATQLGQQVITVNGKHVTTWMQDKGPIGEDVVPAPNRARVAQIDQAISELKQLGPIAKYEPLRRIREAYDGPAKAVYNPSMTADFLTAQGSKMGAADVTGVLRDRLAAMDPATAAANADYSLWKKASDVITAAEETERVRPTVGRTLMARGLGAAAGGGLDGGLGAAIGAMVGPLIERTLAGAAPATKLIVARQMAAMADALRAGDVPRFTASWTTLQKLAPAVAAVGARRATGMVPLALPAAAETEPSK